MEENPRAQGEACATRAENPKSTARNGRATGPAMTGEHEEKFF